MYNAAWKGVSVTAMNGVLAFACAQLVWLSFGNWTVSLYWAWTGAERTESGIVDAGVVEHDILAMNHVIIAAGARALERTREVRDWVIVGAITHVIFLMQVILGISPEGTLKGIGNSSFDVPNAWFVTIVALVLILEGWTRSNYAHRACFWLRDVPLLLALVSSIALHAYIRVTIASTKHRPSHDDFATAFFHWMTAAALCALVEERDSGNARGNDDETTSAVPSPCSSGGIVPWGFAIALVTGPVIPLLALWMRDGWTDASNYYVAFGAAAVVYALVILLILLS